MTDASNPNVLAIPPYEWKQEGVFLDADGKEVRAYDDVLLTRDILIENDPNAKYTIPAGTAATVLFFQSERDGVAELECYWPEDSFSFGFEETRRLKLHQCNEDKWPR